jgi:putative endonuclease
VGRTLSTWRVYILRCNDGTLYTGATNDAERRLQQHSAGQGARYTRSRLPVSVVYEEAASNRGAALRREAALKRLSRAEKLDLIAAPVKRERTEEARTPKPQRTPPKKSTVKPVYRAIVRKNERQAKGLYDVLICGHAVIAATDNTFRKARPCPECRLRVQEYADRHAEDPQALTRPARELKSARG